MADYGIGSCGKCGSENLSYGAMSLFDGDMCYYPFTCDDCGAEGKEWYELSYHSTEMDGGDEDDDS